MPDKLPEEPPHSHPRETQRYPGDTKPPATHAKHGVALQDKLALLLQLHGPGDIAVRCESKEGAAAWGCCGQSRCSWGRLTMIETGERA